MYTSQFMVIYYKFNENPIIHFKFNGDLQILTIF